jgi:hypothetical protein
MLATLNYTECALMTLDEIIATFDAMAGATGRAADTFGKALGLLRRDDRQAILSAQEAALEFQEKLQATKRAVSVLQDEKERLEKRVRELEDHLKQHETMTVKQVAYGATVYVTAVPAEQAGEGGIAPLPWYCQPCFDEGKKAVLQLHKRDFGTDVFQCPRCQAQIQVPNDIRAEAYVVPVARGPRGGGGFM